MPQHPDDITPARADADVLLTAWDRLLYTLGSPAAVASESYQSERQADRSRIPVTILSGFLGAGKTTLLCGLLAETGLNVLAIVNDLAAVNMDAGLVRASSAETIQLENGCACCVLGSDLDRMLSDIGRRDARPDAIVIEASGVSDPSGIAQTVAANAATVLDGILTLVDTNAFEAQLTDPAIAPLIQRQLAAAHLVVLTKTGETAAAIQSRVAALAPGRAVLNAATVTGNLTELVLGAAFRGARPQPETATHSYGQFASCLIDFAGPADAKAFFQLMDNIPDCVYRIKGWITLHEQCKDVRQQFHAVGQRWRISHAECAGDAQSDQLVVIGRHDAPQFDAFCSTLRQLNRNTAYC